MLAVIMMMMIGPQPRFKSRHWIISFEEEGAYDGGWQIQDRVCVSAAL